MGILEFLSHDAGQRRRKALDSGIESTLQYILGPQLYPKAESAARVADVFNPVTGVAEAMQGGRQAVEGEGWDRVQGIGRMTSGMAATLAPMAGKADDAAKVLDALLGWSPARQGAVDEAARFVGDESGAFKAYHGSPHDFEKFDIDEATGNGLWFSNNERYSEGLAGRTNNAKMKDGHMFEVNINAKNPFIIDVEEMAKEVADEIGVKENDLFEREKLLLGGESFETLLDSLGPDIKNGGHDAVVFKNTHDGFAIPTDQIVVFDDKLIDIVKKYGIAAAAPMLGMSVPEAQRAWEQHQAKKSILDYLAET